VVFGSSIQTLRRGGLTGSAFLPAQTTGCSCHERSLGIARLLVAGNRDYSCVVLGADNLGTTMNWLTALKALAPTVATALGTPLAGIAVAAIGNALGVDSPTQDKIAKVFTSGQLTPEALAKIQELELDYQNQEKERGFKFSELEFKDRDSARNMAIATHSLTPSILTWMVVILTLLAEGALLFNQVPPGADPIIIGRVLGTMDSALVMVLSFWFGSNSNSQRKTELLAQAQPLK